MAKRRRPAHAGDGRGATPPSDDPVKRFASRGGLKLEAALIEFGIDAEGKVCVDLGCSTGGFVDCWLQRGAARVYAVDTAYGELAWKLRQDPRVVVMERTNALHAAPPAEVTAAPSEAGAGGGVDLVSMDLGWTRQELAVPAALRWLRQDDPEVGGGAGSRGRVITLIKPHYESGRHQLTDDEADAETRRVVEQVLPGLGVTVLGWMRSPIRGGKGGNLEHLAVLRRG